ncbi:MAG: MCE family protein, partial [Sciscionella sp.]
VIHISADFTAAVGIYVGSDVRILGVKVGRVDQVTPHGTSVRVRMSVDSERQVPANAQAVVVSPSVVADRYVQLTPAYTQGAVMRGGAAIPLSRTAVPVELDQIYKSLDDVATALGPNGANKSGALSKALSVGAANLKGNGTDIGQSLHDLSKAVQTLSGGRSDLFGTVTNLQKLTSALAGSDTQVREFNGNLTAVSQQLAGERGDLGRALHNLSIALGQVATFVHDNKDGLETNLHGLAQVSNTLVAERDALGRFLDIAPTALSNVNDTYNGTSGTLDTRNNFNQLGDPRFVCSLLDSLPASEQLASLKQSCGTLSSTLEKLPKIPGLNAPVPPLPELPKVLPDPSQLPGASQLPGIADKTVQSLSDLTKLTGAPLLLTVPGIGGGQ